MCGQLATSCVKQASKLVNQNTQVPNKYLNKHSSFAFGRRVEKFLANVSGRVCLLEMVNLPVVRPSRTGCVAAESFIVRMISLGQGLGAQISSDSTDELGKTHDPGGGCGGSSLSP